MNYKMSIVSVTPEMATAWLKTIDLQRPISMASVDGYADSMKRKEWRLSNDAVCFNKNGHLRNGQHRLLAVVKSEVICPFLVLENVEDKDISVMDQGRARSLPDLLKMLYSIKRASMVTGCLRAIERHVHERPFKLTVDRSMELIADYSEGLRWATGNLPGKNVFTTAPIVAALVYAYRTAPQSVERFARSLCSGDSIRPGNPVYTLRESLIKKGGATGYDDGAREAFFTALLAIQKTINGQQCKHLRIIHSKDTFDGYRPILEYFTTAYPRVRKSKAA